MSYFEDVRRAKPSSAARDLTIAERQWPRLSEVEAVHIQVESGPLGPRRGHPASLHRRLDADAQFADTAVKGKAEQLAGDMRASSNLAVNELSALFNGLERMPARKSVLLFSEGFLADESWPFVQQAVGLAARANARVYTLDARGLDTHGMAEYLSGPAPSNADALSRLLDQSDPGGDAMNSLAVDTGGFVVRNTNHLDTIVNRIVDNAAASSSWATSPRRCPTASLARSRSSSGVPGLTFRARRGYVAAVVPAPGPATPVGANPGGTDGRGGTAGGPAGAEPAGPSSQ